MVSARHKVVVPWIVAAGLFGVVPFLVSGYVTNFLALTFLFGTLAVGWNIIGGMAGYVAFSTSGFFGLGAYGTALIMVRTGAPFSLSIFISVIIVVVIATVIGAGLLRLRGHYFTVASFVLSELVREGVNNLPSLTGGGMGLGVPLYPGDPAARAAFFYFVSGALLIACVTVSWWVDKSRTGKALRAIREDEDVAVATGVNSTVYKSIAFALHALMSGAAGGVYAYWVNYLEPAGVFALSFSINAVIMALIGGAGTVVGPVIGTFLVYLCTEAVWSYSQELHMALMGFLLVVVVLFLPRGLLGGVKLARRSTVLSLSLRGERMR